MEDMEPTLASIKTRLQNILEVLQSQSKSKGCASHKFETCVKSEIKFLEKLEENGVVECPLKKGSNYHFLTSCFELLESYGGSGELMKIFGEKRDKDSVRVDLVVNNGTKWISVKTRRNYRISDDSEDEEEASESDECDETEVAGLKQLLVPDNRLVKQAMALKNAAIKSLVHYKAPEVVFQFVRLEKNGVSEEILEQLRKIGITIEYGLTAHMQNEETGQISDVVNLDITTLIAMASCITFEFVSICSRAFDSIPLKNQRSEEMVTPLLPVLKNLLYGKKLVCCLDAFKKFNEIISTIGGHKEKQRGFALFDHSGKLDGMETVSPPLNLDHLKQDGPEVENENWKVYVIPNSPSSRTACLSLSMSQHNLNVFGTADELSLTTITANGKFVRSLNKAAGLMHSVVLHKPRGLIEQKWFKYTA